MRARPVPRTLRRLLVLMCDCMNPSTRLPAPRNAGLLRKSRVRVAGARATWRTIVTSQAEGLAGPYRR